MKFVKKYVSFILTLLFIFSSIVSATASSVEPQPGICTVHKNGSTIITITGEENIRNYQEAMGEEYDPTLVAIQRTITQPSLNAENAVSTSATRAVGYEIRNKIVSDGYTDLSTVLAQFNRPAGTISISEEVQIETSIDFSGTASALDFLELSLGYSDGVTITYAVNWEDTFDYPVTIKIYPIYEVTSGDLWQITLFGEADLGYFRGYRPLGDDIRVYRR